MRPPRRRLDRGSCSPFSLRNEPPPMFSSFGPCPHLESGGLLRFRVETGEFRILRPVVESARRHGWNILETLKAGPDRLIRRLGLA